MANTIHAGNRAAIRELDSSELAIVGGGCDPFEHIGGITVSEEEYQEIVEELRKRNTSSCK